MMGIEEAEHVHPRRIGAVLAAAWWVGCAAAEGPPPSGGGRVAAGEFPSPEALEALGDQPEPVGLERGARGDPPRWELEGPFPERVEVEPWTDDSPLARVLAEIVAQRPGLVVPTEAMHCVARELGRFHLADDAPPSETLLRWIGGLCRAPTPRLHHGWLQGAVEPGTSDAELVERWRGQMEEAIRAQLVGGPRSVGVWLGRDGDRALFLVAAGDRHLQLDSLTGPAPDGRVEVEGEVLEPTREVQAVVTRGRLGVGRCDADPELALPRFRFTCQVDPGDPWAWLALSFHPPGRILGELGAELLLRPGAPLDPAYERPAYVPSRQAWDEDTLAAGFVELLNQLRESQELPPLALTPEQSQIARDLAPHFFAAQDGRTAGNLADVIALGMMAGWSVDGILQTAYFAASAVYDSNDVGRLLSEALDRPVSRAALLAADAELIAVGPVLEVVDGRASMGVVVGTYAFFSEEDHAVHARRVFEQLRTARAERGLPAPQPLEEIEELSTLAAAAVQTGTDPQAALREMLDASGQTLRRSVRGWTLQTSALEDIQFPGELLTEPHVGVSIGVSAYRPEGEAWGRYVVMIVAAEPGQGI
jgi:hypothetical protein